MLTYAAIGAGVVIAALSFLLWACHIDLRGKETQIAGLNLRLEDAGRKIDQQNKAVDKWAQDAEIARHNTDLAIAAAKAEVTLHTSRARDIRTALTSPVVPPAERTATKAVAEVRKHLVP